MVLHPCSKIFFHIHSHAFKSLKKWPWKVWGSVKYKHVVHEDWYKNSSKWNTAVHHIFLKMQRHLNECVRVLSAPYKHIMFTNISTYMDKHFVTEPNVKCNCWVVFKIPVKSTLVTIVGSEFCKQKFLNCVEQWLKTVFPLNTESETAIWQICLGYEWALPVHMQCFQSANNNLHILCQIISMLNSFTNLSPV